MDRVTLVLRYPQLRKESLLKNHDQVGRAKRNQQNCVWSSLTRCGRKSEDWRTERSKTITTYPLERVEEHRKLSELRQKISISRAAHPRVH